MRREPLAAALREATGAAVGFERADSVAARKEGLPARQGPLWGEPPAAPIWIRERGRRYRVDLAEGQKTGFYLDQRDARDLVAAAGAGPTRARSVLLHGRLRRRCRARRRAALTLVDSSGPALALAQENLAANAAATPARLEPRRRLRVPARGRRALRSADPRSAADGARGARRRARGARLQGSAAQRAAPLGAAARTCSSSPARTTSAPRSCARSSSAPRSRPGAACACSRRSAPAPDHVVSLDHPEGAYLSRPAARGVSGIARSSRARRALRRRPAATRRRVGARPCCAAARRRRAPMRRLERWAEQAGVFRGAGGADPLAALPVLGALADLRDARPGAGSARRGGARARSGRGRLLRRRDERRGGTRIRDRPARSLARAPALGAPEPARRRRRLPGVSLHARSRGRLRLASARRLRGAASRTSSTSSATRSAVVRSRARARLSGPALRRRSGSADPGRLRRRVAPGREARRSRSSCSRCSAEQAADGSWPLLDGGRSRSRACSTPSTGSPLWCGWPESGRARSPVAG